MLAFQNKRQKIQQKVTKGSVLPRDSRQKTKQATISDKKSLSTKENISSSLILV